MTSPHEGLKRKGWDISGEDLCTWKGEITLYLRDALVLCSMKDNSSNKNEITAIIPSILYANRCDYISDYTIPCYPLRRASQTVQKLFEVTTLYLYCRREKTIKGGNKVELRIQGGQAQYHRQW